jgi:hypothetical protein
MYVNGPKMRAALDAYLLTGELPDDFAGQYELLAPSA